MLGAYGRLPLGWVAQIHIADVDTKLAQIGKEFDGAAKDAGRADDMVAPTSGAKCAPRKWPPYRLPLRRSFRHLPQCRQALMFKVRTVGWCSAVHTARHLALKARLRFAGAVKDKLLG